MTCLLFILLGNRLRPAANHSAVRSRSYHSLFSRRQNAAFRELGMCIPYSFQLAESSRVLYHVDTCLYHRSDPARESERRERVQERERARSWYVALLQPSSFAPNRVLYLFTHAYSSFYRQSILSIVQISVKPAANSCRTSPVEYFFSENRLNQHQHSEQQPTQQQNNDSGSSSAADESDSFTGGPIQQHQQSTTVPSRQQTQKAAAAASEFERKVTLVLVVFYV